VKEPQLTSKVSEEFFIRVNDFIQMANRVERRFDTAHAQMAFVHALARYSAHHYYSTVKADSASERDAYAQHISETMLTLVRHNLDQLAPAQAGDEPAAE